ncbi:MAG: hypothetical protein F4Y84_10135 [Caldilineaceae bacterium SB0665_bin_25]|nr:hypothetical protein [Caldilineaceae bacterium SB0665_bin_25]
MPVHSSRERLPAIRIIKKGWHHVQIRLQLRSVPEAERLTSRYQQPGVLVLFDHFIRSLRVGKGDLAHIVSFDPVFLSVLMKKQ